LYYSNSALNSTLDQCQSWQINNRANKVLLIYHLALKNNPQFVFWGPRRYKKKAQTKQLAVRQALGRM
jgi:hypothetical protein